jgi:predicted nicotinamide N-methyase
MGREADLTRHPVDQHASRAVTISLTDSLSFSVLELLAQPRPNHWARTWPTSVAVSRWLLAQPVGSLPSHAMELGCGTGLVSLTLAHLGLNTLGTDREPLAVALSARNAQRNQVNGFRAERLEWSDTRLSPQTSLLLGSDIVYDATAPEVLFALIETRGLLAASGTLVLGGPAARTELLDGLLQRFVGEGYRHHRERQPVAWEGREEQIDVHALVRP